MPLTASKDLQCTPYARKADKLDYSNEYEDKLPENKLSYDILKQGEVQNFWSRHGKDYRGLKNIFRCNSITVKQNGSS